MNRRAFLGISSAALAAFALDPERLLWRPGARTIFLPSPSTALFYSTFNDRGMIRRGERITPFQYARRHGVDILWADRGDVSEVTFPAMTPPRTLRVEGVRDCRIEGASTSEIPRLH